MDFYYLKNLDKLQYLIIYCDFNLRFKNLQYWNDITLLKFMSLGSINFNGIKALVIWIQIGVSPIKIEFFEISIKNQ